MKTDAGQIEVENRTTQFYFLHMLDPELILHGTAERISC